MNTAKTARLKNLLNNGRLEFICEAHNGLSAKIVEEAGFSGIWASGLSISAALGVRDSNEASWTQVLETTEFMSDATEVPILLDGDTGYGNFNNFRRLVGKLEQRGVAGVCIEDKQFPKANSLIDGREQALEDIDTFCGKIKAGKDAQADPDFCIVARVEAFIAGQGLKAALERAEAYRRAGADAVLIHSKKRTPEEIEAFMKEWANRHPVVIVPTRYYSTPTGRFAEMGVSMVIWANHMVRASAAAMQKAAQKIHADASIAAIEDCITPISEIFRLQGASELEAAELKYSRIQKNRARAVILAASRGGQFGEMTADRPKALLKVNNRTILDDTVSKLKRLNINDIHVVRGYRKEMIAADGYRTIDNDEHETTGDLYSLYLARGRLEGDCLIIYGDCLYRSYLITDLLEKEGDIRALVDADKDKSRKTHDHVVCSSPYTNDFFNRNILLKDISVTTHDENAHGEWAGIIAARPQGTRLIRETLENMSTRSGFKQFSLTDLLKELIPAANIQVVYTKGGWLDIDNLVDFAEAGDFL